MTAKRIDIDALVAPAERLCHAIAPMDLADVPLYIVPQSRLPQHLGGASVCDGFTCPSLDLYLKDVIGPAWQGRGACMVVGDTDFGATMDTVDVQQAFMGTVLHELAHILQPPALYRDHTGENPKRLAFEALVMGHTVATPDRRDQPFAGHDARFIRAALHLQHRAMAVGVHVAGAQLCAGRAYGLSHANRYRQALGDEPCRMADLSIRDMLRTAAPEVFTRLWAEDVAHWLRFRSRNQERTLSQ